MRTGQEGHRRRDLNQQEEGRLKKVGEGKEGKMVKGLEEKRHEEKERRK